MRMSPAFDSGRFHDRCAGTLQLSAGFKRSPGARPVSGATPPGVSCAGGSGSSRSLLFGADEEESSVVVDVLCCGLDEVPGCAVKSVGHVAVCLTDETVDALGDVAP